MPALLDNIQELQRRIESLKKKRDQAIGALDQLTKRLKKEFNCKTEKEGRKLREVLLTQQLDLVDAYLKAKKKFMKQHGKKLGMK